MLISNLRILIVLFSLSLLTACAQMQVNNRLKEYKKVFEPMLGIATKEDISSQYGIPDRTQYLGSSEIWEYHHTFGSRGGAMAYTPNQYNQYGTTTYASGQAREIYDNITLTFDSAGILSNWRVYVQR